MINDLAVVILAAGGGTRLQCESINKVVLPLAGKPMILYTLVWVKKLNPRLIYLVVGYQKQSVKTVVGPGPIYINQKKLLGTGAAVYQAIKKIPAGIRQVLVVYGDHSFFYTDQLIRQMLSHHRQQQAQMTFLTIKLPQPHQFGRILRDRQGNLLGIIEDQHATPIQQKVTEMNLGCYCFTLAFLKQYLPQIKKNKLSGEYYLTDLVNLGIKAQQKVCALPVKDAKLALGINTLDQLLEVDQLMKKYQPQL